MTTLFMSMQYDTTDPDVPQWALDYTEDMTGSELQGLMFEQVCVDLFDDVTIRSLNDSPGALMAACEYRLYDQEMLMVNIGLEVEIAMTPYYCSGRLRENPGATLVEWPAEDAVVDWGEEKPVNETIMRDYAEFIDSVLDPKVAHVVAYNGRERFNNGNVDMTGAIFPRQWDFYSAKWVLVRYNSGGTVVLEEERWWNAFYNVRVSTAPYGWPTICDACRHFYIDESPMSMRVSSYCGCEDERCPDDDYQDEYDPDL